MSAHAAQAIGMAELLIEEYRAQLRRYADAGATGSRDMSVVGGDAESAYAAIWAALDLAVRHSRNAGRCIQGYDRIRDSLELGSARRLQLVREAAAAVRAAWPELTPPIVFASIVRLFGHA
jgi:hypothetical protein